MTARSIVTAILAGLLSLTFYLLVVVLTSPNVPAFYAINAALHINYGFILAFSAGYGLLFYANEELRGRGCRIKGIRDVGCNVGSSSLGAFLSYFSLTQFGCCGFWLYIMSILPGIMGAGATALFLDYQNILMGVALAPLYYMVAVRVIRLARVRSTNLPRPRR